MHGWRSDWGWGREHRRPAEVRVSSPARGDRGGGQVLLPEVSVGQPLQQVRKQSNLSQQVRLVATATGCGTGRVLRVLRGQPLRSAAGGRERGRERGREGERERGREREGGGRETERGGCELLGAVSPWAADGSAIERSTLAARPPAPTSSSSPAFCQRNVHREHCVVLSHCRSRWVLPSRGAARTSTAIAASAAAVSACNDPRGPQLSLHSTTARPCRPCSPRVLRPLHCLPPGPMRGRSRRQAELPAAPAVCAAHPR